MEGASVPHLGFRYTVALVNQTSGKAESVDPDRDFRKGECVRIELESNQSGYLYVLSKQSSGTWLPLFPSPEMPGESDVIDPGQKVRAPKDYCFEINDPPGTETLFVALSSVSARFLRFVRCHQNTPSCGAGEHQAGVESGPDGRRAAGEFGGGEDGQVLRYTRPGNQESYTCHGQAGDGLWCLRGEWFGQAVFHGGEEGRNSPPLRHPAICAVAVRASPRSFPGRPQRSA